MVCMWFGGCSRSKVIEILDTECEIDYTEISS